MSPVDYYCLKKVKNTAMYKSFSYHVALFGEKQGSQIYFTKIGNKTIILPENTSEGILGFMSKQAVHKSSYGLCLSTEKERG